MAWHKRKHINTVRLNLPGYPSLSLVRAPLYLRFVISGSDPKTLDALDLEDDWPEPGETVIVAMWARSGCVHIDGRDKSGKRFGRTERIHEYELLDEQPSQEILRDTARWREWEQQQYDAKQAKAAV